MKRNMILMSISVMLLILPFIEADPLICLNNPNLYVLDGNEGLYSTFIGGGYEDILRDTFIDSDGFIYIVGNTEVEGFGTKFPTTTGSYSPEPNGERDAFVAKIDPKCQNLIFSTYLGGSGYDHGKGIAVDKDGYVYVTGLTVSNDFPTTPGAFNETLNGHMSDIFITKLKPDGSDIVYSTFLGGTHRDLSEKIVVDGNGSAYIVGYSSSKDYPITNPLLSGNINLTELVITKLDPSGSYLEISRRIGNGISYGMDIEIDDKKNIYVTGYADSSGFFVTEDVYDNTHNGFEDVIVVKFDPNGDIIFSTYVGGSYADRGFGIAVDPDENIYVTGDTRVVAIHSADFPVTSGAYKTCINNTMDAFLFKMNKMGTALNYSTYLGGSGGETGYSVKLDERNRAFVAGSVNSDDYHCTYGAYCSYKTGELNPDKDGFLSLLSINGTDLLYSTYFGGSNHDILNSLEYFGNNTVLLGGYSTSSDFPISQGAYQSSKHYENDCFISYLNITTIPSLPKNLSILQQGTSARLIWDPPLFNGGAKITGYKVYRSEDTSAFDEIQTIGKESFYNISDHDPSKIWRFYVTSLNEIGESAPSNIVVSNDLTPPNFIRDNTASVGYTGDPFEFSVEILDNIGLSNVHIEVYQNNTLIFNQSLDNTENNEWISSIIVPHSLIPLNYRFTAVDFRGNLNISLTRTIIIRDNDAPQIIEIKTPDFATTGDELVFECEIIDNIGAKMASVEISGLVHEIESIELESDGNGYWTCSYSVPPDNINDINYRINATDGTNINRTEFISIPVHDNDPPTVLGNHSDISASNGKDFHLSFEIVDNIGVSSSWCLISFESEIVMNISLENNEDDRWISDLSIPDHVSSLRYQLFSADVAGNVFIGGPTDLPVWDVLLPKIIEDGSSMYGYTGDPFEFKVVVEDNRGILSVRSEYWFGDGDHFFLTLEGERTHSSEIMIPYDSLDELYYRFIVLDVSGKSATSNEKNIKIFDNDEPELKVDNIPHSIGTGEIKQIDLELWDNIEVDGFNVEIKINDQTSYFDNQSSVNDVSIWKLNGPVNETGEISITFHITDSSGNENSTGPFSIQLLDIISPSINHIENISIMEGKILKLEIEATDNIGIERVEWNGLPFNIEGDLWEGQFKGSGQFNVEVIVFDEAGNHNTTRFLVIVREKERTINPIIFAFSALVIAVALSLAFYFIYMKKKKTEKIDVNGIDANPGIENTEIDNKEIMSIN